MHRGAETNLAFETLRHGIPEGGSFPRIASVREASTPDVLKSPDNPLGFLKYLQLKIAFEAAGLGTLKYCTNEPNSIPAEFRGQIATTERIEDYEANETAFTVSIQTTDVHAVLKFAKENNILAAMLGGVTSGTKNFGNRKTDYGNDAILAIQTPNILAYSKAEGKDKAKLVEPELTEQAEDTESTEPWYPKAGEYCLTEDTVFAGIGMTPLFVSNLSDDGTGQMIDLTTKNSADHTAVYMTGGQGPSRLKPSKFIKRVIASDGKKVFEITGEDNIKKYEGTLGLHITVLAIEYYRFESPKNKFLFFAPLNVTALSPEDEGGDWVTPQSQVIGHLQPSFIEVDAENKRLKSAWPGGYIRGAEVMTRGGINLGNSYVPNKMAKELLGTMNGEDGNGDSFYSLYIPGDCDEDPEQLLYEAICKYGAYEEFDMGSAKDFEDDNERIAKLRENLPLPEDSNPFEMMVYLRIKGIIRTPHLVTNEKQYSECEALREAIPDAAKNEAKKFKKAGPTVSESTDNNVGIKPEVFEAIKLLPPEEGIAKLIQLHRALLDPVLKYDSSLHHLQKELAELSQTREAAKHVKVNTHHYGHWNNAHQRYTVAADFEGVEEDPEMIAEITKIQKTFAERAKAIHKQLTDDILALRENPEHEVYEGEKGLLPQHRLLTTAQTRFLIQQLYEDPHNTSELLGWRIKGTPQEEFFAQKREEFAASN